MLLCNKMQRNRIEAANLLNDVTLSEFTGLENYTNDVISTALIDANNFQLLCKVRESNFADRKHDVIKNAIKFSINFYSALNQFEQENFKRYQYKYWPAYFKLEIYKSFNKTSANINPYQLLQDINAINNDELNCISNNVIFQALLINNAILLARINASSFPNDKKLIILNAYNFHRIG